jgi:two-component system, OmpR family, response regulator ResD
VAARRPNPGCILIVDDDEGFRAAVSALLTSAGFATEEAACADTALAAARRVGPDLALVDIRLPGRSGYEVLRELRAIADRPLPVILISGERTEPFDRAAGLGLGADDYIVKPFDEEELLARSGASCRRARPTREART